jgi:hypothetical protein
MVALVEDRIIVHYYLATQNGSYFKRLATQNGHQT